jgi:tol-pal system protein YbgF
MRLYVLAPLSVLALAAALPACARSAEERQLDDMRAQIDELQADRDRADRETLAPEVADARGPGVPARVPAPLPPPPPPAVSVGGQPQAEDVPDPDDPTPRPTIRVVGRAVPDDGSTPAATRSSALDPEAKRAYDRALALVRSRQCDRALDALASFLVKWPDHPYADNAMFWRGECYFAKGDYLRAAEQLEGVVSRFPAGNKAPDALLELGICRQRLGDAAAAKQAFDLLAQQYPQSDAARRIPPITVPAATPPGPASEDPR